MLLPRAGTPRTATPNGLKGKVLSTASSLDAKVDRALDRVDGYIERFRASKTNFSPLSTSEASGGMRGRR